MDNIPGPIDEVQVLLTKRRYQPSYHLSMNTDSSVYKIYIV
jgi:heat shock protein HspQ